MTWKAYALVSGAGLLATYLVSAPPGVTPDRAPRARPEPVTRAADPAVSIQEQATRLETNLQTQTEYEEPSRNPFRFAGRSAPPEPGTPAPEPPPAPVIEPVAPPPAPIELLGIATEMVDGARQRMAVLATRDGIVRVRAGDAVGSEYRVARIDADAIELTSSDGSIRRIDLRP